MRAALWYGAAAAFAALACGRTELDLDRVDAGAGACGAPRSTCGSTCVDVLHDPANCGGCGLACTSGICDDGKCADTCAPLEACNGHCTDTSKDNDNCGACEVVCATPQSCVAGACACPSGQTTCNGVCVDVALDSHHCGSCAVSCGTNEGCVGGNCLPSTNIWPTLGGNALHSGFNAIENGKPPLTLAWTKSLSSGALSPVVADETQLYVAEANGFYMTHVWAVSPTDGHQLWAHDFGSVFSVGQPTVSSGHVYVATCNNSSDTYMHALASSTGAVEWDQPFYAQWEHYWAPLVVGGRVYADGGEFGGLNAFDQPTGSSIFSNAMIGQYDEWSPMFFGGKVMTFVAGNLRGHDPSTGVTLFTDSVTWNWSGWSMKTSPVSDGTRIYVIAPPNLYAFEPMKSAPAWTANASYAGMPAVANGVVFAISAGHLHANDAASGADLWSFAGDGVLSYPPVIAGTSVYVASASHVYAIDIGTQAQTWSATRGGWLSLAGGTLYVAGANGVLAAYTLGL